jgi:regulator of RNase E activity RraA
MYLRERVVAKVLEGGTELGGRDVARTILVDGPVKSSVGCIRGLRTLVALGQQGSEGLVVHGLGRDLDLLGQLRVIELL